MRLAGVQDTVAFKDVINNNDRFTIQTRKIGVKKQLRNWTLPQMHHLTPQKVLRMSKGEK